jgi:hypothetical protein
MYEECFAAYLSIWNLSGKSLFAEETKTEKYQNGNDRIGNGNEETFHNRSDSGIVNGD